MSTIKLGKKPLTSAIASRPPVRRADPAKRLRTAANKPAVKPVQPAEAERSEPSRSWQRENQPERDSPQKGRRETPRSPGKTLDSGLRRNDSPKADSKEKNHRRSTDGKPKFTDRDTPRRGGKSRDGFEAGDFNRDRATNPMFSPKPVASNPDMPRLSKRMAELGLCSRREAEEWIVNGWVKVDGVVVDTLGTRGAPHASIEVSASAQQAQSENVTILLHKPVGFVSGQAEDGYQPAMVLVQPENQWQESTKPDPTQPKFKRGHLRGLAPAGRLDIDSTGLLVFTQDGRVARQLIGDDSKIEKEYLVRVEGSLSEDGLRKLNHGLELDGVKLKPAKVSWQNEDQLRFVLREGRKRQIRRMCELVGLKVTGLKRVRIGSVALGKLPIGKWRYLRHGERF
jgi:23S rRNA pseudouridine2604 synthase